ncbi:hypothetical protein EDD70_2857 [Hydrogenoanaerobacterium saccharovorans]|uniref:Peptidase_C39 like family protein n=1 Tax=Hydrogenoanaerobacterium saccharovorans TaxID=474960 RepID=A0A1H8E3D8_9FIRM|nr:hypothetical protein [Hydrogenoanaerobacterium saccharovorans]RPF42114.1 hypothetical protein EDD70_2857 [Hydrogenoanaerobacterium saccharovorans]SEN13946.1 hypothetical protein SAMN05216180_2873 [Hydrogenoanaerobacterium saccharovorans]
MKCPLYLQRDLSEDYGEKYGKNVCALCSLAAASCIELNDFSITPEQAIEDGAATKTSPFINNWSVYCNISQTKKVSEKTGFKKLYEEIEENKHPVIVQLKTSFGYHYVVAYHVLNNFDTAEDVYVMDPWQGYVTLQEAYDNNDFSCTWSGYRTVRERE